MQDSVKKFLLFILVCSSLALSAQPILFDSKMSIDSDSLRFTFNLYNIPSGSKIVLSLKSGNDNSMVYKDINKDIITEQNRTITIPLQDIDEYRFYLSSNDLLYSEMVYVPAGRYNFERKEKLVEQISLNAFYISKYEVSNEQFKQFIMADGYDSENKWLIDKGLMKDPNIGWFYQGLKRITKPLQWNYNKEPWYIDASLNRPSDPVTGVTWFEINAFCNTMNVSLPSNSQIEMLFPTSIANPIQKEVSSRTRDIISGVSEWTLTGTPPASSSCGGCNEMICLQNSEEIESQYPIEKFKCPLYRNSSLGFRYVINK